MALPVSDNFNRSNALLSGGSLSWAAVGSASAGVYIESNKAVPYPNFGVAWARVTSDTFNDNQQAWATVSAYGINNAWIGVAARMSGTSTSDYACYAILVAGNGAKIIKRSGGSTTTLKTLAGKPSTGQELRIRVYGSSTVTIEAVYAGTLYDSTTDSSSPIASGTAGLMVENNPDGAMGLDDFGADNYTVASGAPLHLLRPRIIGFNPGKL